MDLAVGNAVHGYGKTAMVDLRSQRTEYRFGTVTFLPLLYSRCYITKAIGIIALDTQKINPVLGAHNVPVSDAKVPR